MTLALVQIDTPAVREFLTTRWRQRGDIRGRLIQHLDSGSWQAPHMDYLVPLMAEMQSTHLRPRAARILGRIGTTSARACLESWTADGDEAVAETSREQLEILKQSDIDAARLREQGAALVAGKMAPDDLLEPAVAYVWNGTEYEAQTEAPAPPE